MKRTRGLPLVILITLSASAAALELDLERDCLACHTPSQKRGDVPLIEGQHAAYLRNQLASFRDLHRQGFPMTALASGMDEQVIETIAQALSNRPWQRSAHPIAREAAERGGDLVGSLNCTSCHGNTFEGKDSRPRLAGQTAGYLRRQIGTFANGEREHPLSTVDGHLYTLDETQVRDIAAHLHALR